MARISYVELPVNNLAEQREFYSRAFGWTFTDFGPDYSAMTSGDVDLGLNGSGEQATAHLLPVVEVDDIEAALDSVFRAGGTITLPIFEFPGGRRFHFRDPHGHELGVFVNEPAAD